MLLGKNDCSTSKGGDKRFVRGGAHLPPPGVYLRTLTVPAILPRLVESQPHLVLFHYGWHAPLGVRDFSKMVLLEVCSLHLITGSMNWLIFFGVLFGSQDS